MTSELKSRRPQLIALALSVPSMAGVVALTIAKTVELSGNRTLGNEGILAVPFLFSLVLVPFSTIAIGVWALVRLVNHGQVPRWLVVALMANGLVFYYLYGLTH